MSLLERDIKGRNRAIKTEKVQLLNVYCHPANSCLSPDASSADAPVPTSIPARSSYRADISIPDIFCSSIWELMAGY